MNKREQLQGVIEQLVSEDLEAAIPAAPTAIESAAIIDATDNMPQHVEIWGWTAPQIRFVIKCPIPGSWNGRSLFVGSGGPGGIVCAEEADRGLRLGFATITCDTGHAATGLGSLWSWGNADGMEDWAWRGVHRAATAAHEVIRRIYGRAIEYRYFVGVSTGGRHALIEAQRFPDDFDGILANDSGHNYIYATFTWPWLAQQLYRADQTPIIEAADMPVIVGAVLEQGIAAGAVEDGVIVRPWQVEVDVDAIPLSKEKQEALRCIYHGPVEQPSERGFAGMLPGSEAHGDWEFLFAGSMHLYFMARGLIRFQIYDEPAGPAAPLTTWNPDQWPEAFSESLAGCSALDPDIDDFRTGGGKLLMTQSLGDGWVDPRHALWYWEDLVERYGAETSDSVRLFMIPGRGHGSGFFHYGHTDETLDLLVRWVEEGIPPETIEVDGHSLQPVRADHLPLEG